MSKPKRIAVNTRFLLHNKLEGIGWFTYEVMKRMVKEHSDVEFHFFFDRPFHTEFLFGSNVVPHIVNPPARHPLLWYYWFEHALPAALQKLNADLFLSTDGFLSLKTKIPTVMVVHDLAFEHFPKHVNAFAQQYYKRYCPQYARKASKIITVSEFSKNDIIKQYKINAEKICVAHNGANELYKPIAHADKAVIKAKYTDGKEYFIYVGSVHPRKNTGRLLQAFDAFKKKSNADCKLLIAGRMAWKFKDIERIFENMQYKHDVVFTGHKNIDELSQLTAAALCMCYVSSFEGFGIPVLEAMKCGVPVITSNTSSMPEVGSEAALLVSPDSVDEIAVAMQKVFADENLRTSMIDKGNAQAKKFSWDKTAEIVWRELEKFLR